MSACCELMRDQLDFRCTDHPDLSDCPDSLVSEWPDGRYGLRIHDGGESSLVIAFCPWCGTSLT